MLPSFRIGRCGLPAIGLVLCLALPATAQAVYFDFGAASQYVVLGLDGTLVNLSNVGITGDVGVGPGGTLLFAAPSSVRGNIRLDATAGISQNVGTLVGSMFAGQDLSGAVASALVAASTYAAIPATQPAIGTISSSVTINGNGGLNVLSIGNINMGGGLLILNGGPNDLFVLNVTGGITLGGSAQILGGGSVQPNQILINVIGTGSKLTSHVGNYVGGIILAPERSVEFHSITGQVIAGGAELKLMSGATVLPVPLQASTWGGLKTLCR